jgi:predicted nuclease of predicted toxin-antitoxin system
VEDRPRLLLDENVSYPILRALRQRGWDVVHVKDIGMRTATDSSVLDAAVNSGRIILTSDFSDYKALDSAFRSEGQEHPGIILLPEKPIGEVLRSLEAFDFDQIHSTIRFL